MTAYRFLEEALQAGPLFLGEVRVTPDLVITHQADVAAGGLTMFSDPADALEISRYDEAGKYRPLKTAANLKRGWLLRLADLRQTLRALDFLYPAALGTLAAREAGRLPVIPLRETLARQSGMYAVVKKITDEQVAEVVEHLCHGEPPCLRHILWAADATPPSQDALLCAEACNLFVAEGRKVVKGEPAHH